MESCGSGVALRVALISCMHGRVAGCSRAVATVFERYKDKEYANAVAHRTTPEFRKFREALTALAPEIDGHSYYESASGGFMGR